MLELFFTRLASGCFVIGRVATSFYIPASFPACFARLRCRYEKLHGKGRAACEFFLESRLFAEYSGFKGFPALPFWARQRRILKQVLGLCTFAHHPAPFRESIHIRQYFRVDGNDDGACLFT